MCGLTRVWNSPSTSPPRTLTAPISVIIEPAVGGAAGGLEVDDAEGDVAQRPAQLVEAALRLPPGGAHPGRRATWLDARGGHRQGRATRTGVTRATRARRRGTARTPAGPSTPDAARWRCRLRQPDPLRRRRTAYDGVLALRPGRRAPRRGHRVRDGASSRSPAAGADGPTRSSSSRHEAGAVTTRLALSGPVRTRSRARRTVLAADGARRLPPSPRASGRRLRARPPGPARGTRDRDGARRDDEFRERVGAQVAARPRRRRDDPVDVAARAWLTAAEGWDGRGREAVVRRPARARERPRAGRGASWSGCARRLARRRAGRASSGAPQHAPRSTSYKAENATLRRKLGEARTAERAARAAPGRRGRPDGDERTRRRGSAAAAQDKELRRLRAQRRAAARRSARRARRDGPRRPRRGDASGPGCCSTRSSTPPPGCAASSRCRAVDRRPGRPGRGRAADDAAPAPRQPARRPATRRCSSSTSRCRAPG